MPNQAAATAMRPTAAAPQVQMQTLPTAPPVVDLYNSAKGNMTIMEQKHIEMPFAASLMKPSTTQTNWKKPQVQEKPDFTKVNGKMACQKPAKPRAPTATLTSTKKSDPAASTSTSKGFVLGQALPDKPKTKEQRARNYQQ